MIANIISTTALIRRNKIQGNKRFEQWRHLFHLLIRPGKQGSGSTCNIKRQMNKGCKFLKKLGRYIGGGNNNIIWFYQQS